MVATSRQQQRGSVPPSVAARWALWTFVAVNVAIVEILFFTEGTGKNDILTVAKFFGLHAALHPDVPAAAGGPAAVAGPPHRHGPADGVAPVGRLHPALDDPDPRHARRARLRDAGRHDDGARRSSRWPACRPRCSACSPPRSSSWSAALSTRAVRRRLRYETWHALHLLLYLALALAFVHQLLETTTFKSSPFAFVYWWALWLVAFGALVVGRIVVPLRAQRPPPVPGRGRGAGVGRRRVGARHRPRPGPAARPGRPVLHLALPRPQPLVAGEPVLAVRRAQRPLAAADRQGRRRHQRRPAAGPGRQPACSWRVRTARSPRCTAPGPARC